MTTYEMLITAAKQSAIDCCCTFNDFFPKIRVFMNPRRLARKENISGCRTFWISCPTDTGRSFPDQT